MRPILLKDVRKGEYFTLTNNVKYNEDGCVDIDDWSAYGWEYYGDKVIYWCDINNIKLTKK